MTQPNPTNVARAAERLARRLTAEEIERAAAESDRITQAGNPDATEEASSIERQAAALAAVAFALVFDYDARVVAVHNPPDQRLTIEHRGRRFTLRLAEEEPR